MKRAPAVVALIFLCVPLPAKEPPSRPPIFRIARVQVFVTNLAASRDFYVKVLNHAHDCNWCEHEPDRALAVNRDQEVVLSTVPSRTLSNIIGEITFMTDNLAGLRRYLTFHKLALNKPNKPTDNYLTVIDPEGHLIAFVERPPRLEELHPNYSSAMRLFRVGFVVHNRDAEDRFYRDILGFHVYRQGRRDDTETDWVDMQVPDGTDCVEYMLDASSDASYHKRAALNHIALAVENIRTSAEQLWDDRVLPILQEPKIGRDGALQLDLYDPDGMCVELREFVPEQKANNIGPHAGQKP
jgi:catechol 2,3-dioxygenase-like lactoylglutathione lyase family enzyme